MKYFLFIVAFIVFVSCNSNKIPPDIISPDSMKLIMWDMSRVNALAQNQYRKDSAMFFAKSKEYYQEIFNIHHITKDEFYKSYDYYTNHPDKNKLLMDSLAAFADRKRVELYQKLK